MQHTMDYDTMTLDELQDEVAARIESTALPEVIAFGTPDEVWWWGIQGHVPLPLARLAILSESQEDTRPEHVWWRFTGEENEEVGKLMEPCEETSPGAFPLTLGESGALCESAAMTAEDLREFLRELDSCHSTDPTQGRLPLQAGAIHADEVGLDEAEALITSGRAE
jgi:hypothetical protein